MINSMLTLFALLLICNLSAQSDKNVEKGLFKINALLPGISYELGAGKNTTFNFDVILGFALNGGSDRRTEFGLYPGVGAEFRYYYNMDRRLNKGKNISQNSGNYLSFANQLLGGTSIIGELDYVSNFYYNTGILYGFQRTYEKGFYFNIGFGPGVFVDEYDSGAGLFLDARLGWVIRKRR